MGIVIRQTIKGTIVNYIGTVVGFITTFFVLVRFLSAEEIGLTRVLIDAAMLFVALAQLGTSSSAMRYYPYFRNAEDGKDHGFFFWTVIIPFFGFLIFSLFYFLFKIPISNLFSEKSPLFVEYYYLVLPLAFFMLYQTIFEVNANLLMRIVVPKFVREVLIRVLLLGVYLLFAFKVLSMDGFVVAICAVYAVASLCNVIYLFVLKRISLKPDFDFLNRKMVRDYLFYALMLIAAALVGAITPAINTFFISAKMGLAYTGIFAIASYMAAIIEIPYRSLGTIALPQLSSEMKDQNVAKTNELCQQVSLHQFLAASFILLFIWVNVDVIFNLLPNGEQYVSGKWVVLILGLSKLIQSTLSIVISVLNFSKYYYLSLVFTFVLTASAIVLNNVLIPILGMNGAAIATCSAQIIYFTIALSIITLSVKITPFSLPQLKVLLVVLFMLLLNYVWSMFLTPLFATFGDEMLWATLIDALLKSSLLLFVGIFITYKWGISVHFNQILQHFLSKK